MWFARLREKQLLLEKPEATGLRTRQSRYLENSMGYFTNGRCGTSRPASNAMSFTLTLSVLKQRDKCVAMASAYISESKAVAIGECGRFLRRISITADPHTRLQITRMPILILERYGLSSRKNSRFPSDACTSLPLLKCANIITPFELWPVMHSIPRRGLCCHTRPFLALLPDLRSPKTPKGFKMLPPSSFR